MNPVPSVAYSPIISIVTIFPSLKKTKFIPFAVSSGRIKQPSKELRERFFLLHFSGILYNRDVSDYSDIRRRIQRSCFYCLFNFPLLTRPALWLTHISWHPLFYSRLLNYIASLYPRRQRLSEIDYFKTLNNTIFTLCPTSPLNLISTRLFEVMASGSIPLMETTADLELIDVNISKILSNYKIKSVKNLLADLNRKNIDLLQDHANSLQASVLHNHTWADRAALIRTFLLASREHDPIDS